MCRRRYICPRVRGENKRHCHQRIERTVPGAFVFTRRQSSVAKVVAIVDFDHACLRGVMVTLDIPVPVASAGEVIRMRMEMRRSAQPHRDAGESLDRHRKSDQEGNRTPGI